MIDGLTAVKVVNRRRVPYEGQFNGQVVVFKPGEGKYLMANVARGLVKDSLLKIDLASGQATHYALAIEQDGEPVKPLKGSLAVKNDVEALDRRNDYRMTETEPKILTADGEEDMGIGKADKIVAPLPTNDPDASPPPADEMKTLTFRNGDVRRGPQYAGESEHRVAVKQG